MHIILQTVCTVEELRLPVYLPVVAVMFDQEKVSALSGFLVILHVVSVTHSIVIE